MPTIRTPTAKTAPLSTAEAEAIIKQPVVAQAVNYSVTAAHNREVHELANGVTATLPTVSGSLTETDDFFITFKAMGASATINPNSQNVDGAGANITLGQYETVTLVMNAGKTAFHKMGVDLGIDRKNHIINGNFAVNQRVYVSGAAVGVGLYGHDRWKMAASADTYTFSTTANKTTVTIPATKVLQQVIEGLNLQTGTYCLSWEGTAQGKIGAGALSASGVTGAITGGTNTTIEFGPGTVANIQLEFGTSATSFESRNIGEELALCQRYYQSIPAQGIAINTGVISPTKHPVVDMRASPTLVFTGSIRRTSDGATRTGTGVGVAGGNNILTFVAGTWSVALAAGEAYDSQAGAVITASAEL